MGSAKALRIVIIAFASLMIQVHSEVNVQSLGAVKRQVRNFRQCTRLCEYTATCRAVVFHFRSGSCRLYFSRSETNSTMPQPHLGELYTAVDSEAADCPDSAGSPCRMGSFCAPLHALRSHLCLSALQEFKCPASLPSLQHGNVSVDDVTLHAKASYSCLTDFAFFGTTSHVTCLANLSWSELEGSCKQVTWRNMAPPKKTGLLNFTTPLPSPVLPGCRVDVTGTPTQGDGFRINLKVGKNNFVHFRSRRTGKEVWVALTNVYHDDLGRRPSNPFKVGRTFNVSMVLDENTFKIYLDGKYYDAIDHPQGAGRVDEVHIRGSVSFSSCSFFCPTYP